MLIFEPIDPLATREIHQTRAVFDPADREQSIAGLTSLEPQTEHGQVAVRAFLLALDLHLQDTTGVPMDSIDKLDAITLRFVRATLDRWNAKHGEKESK